MRFSSVSVSFSAAALAATLAAGCASAPEPAAPALPAHVVEAMQAPTARSAKLYVGADGALDKVVAYVDRSAVPEWVHQMADAQLGAGEPDEFEVEQYADGTRTYEVTRTIDGRKAEMSVTVDKALRYVERELAADAVPPAIRQAADGLEGVTVERIEEKKGEGIDQYEVVGKAGAFEVRVSLTPSGEILSYARRLPAVIQLSR